jgi:hypothetical protein
VTRSRAILLAALLAAVAPAARAAISVQFDYRYDTGFFTGHPERRATLEFAAASLARFTDGLAAIIPYEDHTWEAQVWRPDTDEEVWLPNLEIPADTLLVFAGARPLGGSLGTGGPGGWSAAGYDGAWFDTVQARGETGALAAPFTDVGPWGGSLAFATDPDVSWYFGLDPAGLAPGQSDFLSVAMHELGHLLGIGTSDSWDRWIVAGTFRGPAARAEYGGNVPVTASHAHWLYDTESTVDGVVQEAAMDPNLTQGTRKLFTDLDFAGLDDVGWEVTVPRDVWSGAAGTAWADGANWSTGLAPAPSSTAVFDGPPSPPPVLGSGAWVRRLEFRTAGWTVGGAGTLTVTWGGAASEGAGTNTVLAPVAMGTSCTWTVAAGNTLALAGGLNAGGYPLAKTGPGTLELAAVTALPALEVQAGTVRLAAGAGGPLVTAALAINDAAGAALDLTDRALALDYPDTGHPADNPYADVAAWVSAGASDLLANPADNWTGPGLRCSAAAAEPQGLTAVGILDNNDPHPFLGGLTAFEGVAVDGSTVLVKYTWYGDANLDGLVDSNDLDLLEESWGATGPEVRWGIGDFNYDGLVDSNDLDLLELTWTQQSGTLGGAAVAAALLGASAPAPEPATLALVALGGLGLALRRR